jgi:electron transfer flavoprotein beta subunit
LKILVTVKKVVDVELNIKVKDNDIVNEGLQYVMNAWDENAVETAIQLKEQHNAETELVSIGNDDNTIIIRKAYAMGIEKGIHINDPALEKGDSNTYAKLLQKLWEKRNYDLVISGKQAQDTDNGHTGIMLAEYLELPCVSNVVGIEVIDDKNLKVSRLGDLGTEVLEVDLPAVITVSDSINEPRLPALRGIMMAKKKPIEVVDLAGLGVSADDVDAAVPRTEVLEFQMPEARKAGKKFEGDVAEITTEVVNLLLNEAKVL